MDYKFLFETNEAIAVLLSEVKTLKDLHNAFSEILRGLDAFKSYIESFKIQDDVLQKKILNGVGIIEKAVDEINKKTKTNFSEKDKLAIKNLAKGYEQLGSLFKLFKKNHIKRLDKNTMIILDHLNNWFRQLYEVSELGLLESSIKVKN